MAAFDNARRALKARRVSFQARSSTPLHLFGVELEEVGDDFGFGRVGCKAVGGCHGAVVRLVCGAEVGWHCERVVEIGQRAIQTCHHRGFFFQSGGNPMCPRSIGNRETNPSRSASIRFFQSECSFKAIESWASIQFSINTTALASTPRQKQSLSSGIPYSNSCPGAVWAR